MKPGEDMRVMKAKRRIRFEPRQRPDSGTYMVDIAIMQGEHVLLLGLIDNSEGNVAVSNWEGNVLWPVNFNDLEELDSP